MTMYITSVTIMTRDHIRQVICSVQIQVELTSPNSSFNFALSTNSSGLVPSLSSSCSTIAMHSTYLSRANKHSILRREFSHYCLNVGSHGIKIHTRGNFSAFLELQHFGQNSIYLYLYTNIHQPSHDNILIIRPILQSFLKNLQRLAVFLICI